MSINLLYKREYPINDKLRIIIPTVGEVLDQEDEYYSLLYTMTSTPYDMMVELDDMGIDYSKINDYQLFLLYWRFFSTMDTSLIFGDLDLSKFEIGVNEENANVILLDRENDIKIDRAIHGKITAILRRIHHLEKNNRKPGNEDAKKYLLERARKKRARRQNNTEDSELKKLIVSMVNAEQFKYNYETVKDLTIYQFNESVLQIVSKVDYDNRMHGVFSGTVDAKKLSQDELNWLSHK